MTPMGRYISDGWRMVSMVIVSPVGRQNSGHRDAHPSEQLYTRPSLVFADSVSDGPTLSAPILLQMVCGNKKPVQTEAA